MSADFKRVWCVSCVRCGVKEPLIHVPCEEVASRGQTLVISGWSFPKGKFAVLEALCEGETPMMREKLEALAKEWDENDNQIMAKDDFQTGVRDTVAGVFSPSCDPRRRTRFGTSGGDGKMASLIATKL